MHELSIAQGLVEQVLEISREQSLVTIDEIAIDAGELRQVVPEVMQEAFVSVVKDTIAEVARLTISEVSMEAKCNLCKRVFKPEIDDYRCPDCNVAEVEIVKGNEIILRSISGKGKE